MVDILEELQQYVPTVRREKTLDIPGTEEQVAVQDDRFHHILFGGDQLTAARVRGAQRIRENSESASARLQGLVPVCEDWHAKQCLMGVRIIIIIMLIGI